MRLRTATIAVMLVAAPLAGCGSSDDEPAAEADAAEPAAEEDAGDAGDGRGVAGSGDDDGGGGSATSSGSDRPDSVRGDFPVPFPAGWEIDIQGEIGMTDMSSAQLLYPNDAYDGIVAFYDDWFESQPDEFARTVAGERVAYQLLGETFYQVNVVPDHQHRDETWVLLQVSGGVELN